MTPFSLKSTAVEALTARRLKQLRNRFGVRRDHPYLDIHAQYRHANAELGLGAFNEYKNRLNWDCTADALVDLCREALKTKA
jgi:hypothetical protein